MTTRTTAPAPTLRALVAGVVDYAGLFPPSALTMAQAVAAYATYLASAEAWALGRFVVPLARMEELVRVASRYVSDGPRLWRLSALAGDDAAAAAVQVRSFNAAHAGRFLVDVIELQASSVAAVTPSARAFGDELTVFVELPIADEPREWLQAVQRAGARAKVRTGGTTPAAFPTVAQLARFIMRCAELGVPFKATAGLHHPLRAEQPLTYDADAASATMFGFVNVFLAGAFARAGLREPAVTRLLEERDAAAITFGNDDVRWREHTITLDQLRAARESFALTFGSCSFIEPIDDLRHLALL